MWSVPTRLLCLGWCLSIATSALLEFVDTEGTKIDASTLTTWKPTVTGEWDGLMHIEITDATGRIHRRQCLEWFQYTAGEAVTYGVTLDRPYNELIANNSGAGALKFRIHQPEFSSLTM